MKFEVYEVELHRPPGVTVEEMKEYIKEAVQTWGGQLPADDPLFYPWGDGNEPYPEVRVRRRYP